MRDVLVGKEAIRAAVQTFADGGAGLRAGALGLFAALGYRSEKTVQLVPATAQGLQEMFGVALDARRAQTDDWLAVELLLQLTDEEMQQAGQPSLPFAAQQTVDGSRIESYVFFAIQLRAAAYTRTQLATITRELNKHFPMPVLILFQHGQQLTIAIINRRLHKKDAQRDVLEKVTLIKDIDTAMPHRAHIDILYDLSLPALAQEHPLHNFVALQRAWEYVLSSSELNRRFYREIANWYFWATQHVTFPAGAEADEAKRNAISIIRLITRLIFVWFLKEKGLVPPDLFNEQRVQQLLADMSPDASSYYRAILQNLFFATLNQEMDKREFRKKNSKSTRDQHHLITTLYRYQDAFAPGGDAQLLALMRNIPFLNGGLFECLDYHDAHDRVVRIDGFSDRADNPLRVPNMLFFADVQDVDLHRFYGTSGRTHKVRGLLHILSHYKFTVTENTPIEEEIALDPELLGQVFENLLAAYNPETGATARKQTGSFYTPREIVNYMVDESLVAYLETAMEDGQGQDSPQRRKERKSPDKNRDVPSESSDERGRRGLPPAANPYRGETEDGERGSGDDSPSPLVGEGARGWGEWTEQLRVRLRHLLAYNAEPPQFDAQERQRLIRAIDRVKILDPACGSGAFPIGMLQKLVFLLGKLDPGNEQWKQRQLANVQRDMQTAEAIADEQVRENALELLQQKLLDIERAFAYDSLDYARKLYLIQNCIYGVDIQPIAVQIAKLRCFIALIVDQQTDEQLPNRGILALPNLETRFVAANTLLGSGMSQGMLRGQMVIRLEQELETVRQRHFDAKTPKTKNKYRTEDERIRRRIGQELTQDGVPGATADRLARWNPYDQNAMADFFDAEWMFGVGEGFDVVIGNPPYVRQEQLKELKPHFKDRYTCYTGTADLYVYFYERSLELLREGGVLTFISSNKYFRAAYGKKLRQMLGKQTTIQQMIDFGDAPVFTAIAYPSIIITRKGEPKTAPPPRIERPSLWGDRPEQEAMTLDDAPASRAPQVRVLSWPAGADDVRTFAEVFDRQSFLMAQKELTTDGWRLEPPAVLRLLEKLRKAGKPLGEYVQGRFYRGITTGLNEAFVVDRATRDRLIAEHASSAELLKPFLRGRDVKRWRVNYQDLWIIFTRRDIDIKKHPAIYEYLLQYKERLMPGVSGGRKTGNYKWYHIQDKIAYWQEFEQPKIVIPAISPHVAYASDLQGYYCNDKTSICVAENVNFLLGLLNSSPMWWFMRQIAATKQGGFYEFKPMYVSQIPIPAATPQQQAAIAGVVERILAAKQADAAADVSALEAEIDELVYGLYGLTAEEVGVIENG